MKIKNLTKKQKESIEHFGILELFEGCGKNLSGNYGRNFNDRECGKRRLCLECKAKIQQAQKDFKREAEEVREVIKQIEDIITKLDTDFLNGEQIKGRCIIEDLKDELNSKQNALKLASELEEWKNKN